ncbi:MAG TPA: hypothetical protein DCL54_19655 [Alphaproteobacteria bacterium]|nr:hypothetical protein [Alphaproteobacteria bacterium]
MTFNERESLSAQCVRQRAFALFFEEAQASEIIPLPEMSHRLCVCSLFDAGRRPRSKLSGVPRPDPIGAAARARAGQGRVAPCQGSP